MPEFAIPGAVGLGGAPQVPQLGSGVPATAEHPTLADMGDGELFGARVPVAPVPPPPSVEERLNLSQTQARELGTPEQAKALYEKAAQQGASYRSALADPESVGGTQPYDPPWAEHVNNKPLSNALVDPATAAVLAPDEIRAMAEATGIDEDPLSRTYLGQVEESQGLGLEVNDIYFRMLLNGGVPSPEQAARLTQIEARLGRLPTSDTTGGQVVAGILGQGRVMGRLALAAGGGALIGSVVGPAGTAAGAKVGAVLEGVHMAVGNTYGALRQNGIPHNVAAPLGVAAGIAIGGIDALSFGALAKFPWAKTVAASPAMAKLTKETIGPAIRAAMKDSRFARIVAELGKDALREAPPEMVQEMIDIAAEYTGAAVAGTGRVPTVEEAQGRVLTSGLVGAVAGPVVGSFGTFAREMTVKTNAGEQSQAAIDKLYDTAEKLEKVPAAVKEKFGNDLAEEGAVKTITVPIVELDALLQKAELPATTQAWMTRPETERALATARAGGTRVSLPLGEFMAHVQPLDAARTLNQIVGLNDEMSPKEAKALKPAVEKARKEMKDVAKRQAVIDAGPEGLIIRDLEQKLLKVGATAQAARMQAELVASGISALARKTGKDPWSVFQDAPLTVGRVIRDEAAGVTSLEQADPKSVIIAPDSRGDTAYQHPESPLRLWMSDNLFASLPIPDDTKVVGILGFDPILGVDPKTGKFDPAKVETQENIAKYGGQGYSAALYVRALTDAKAQGVGFASDTTRTPATLRQYDRLREMGFPFKRQETDPGTRYTRDFEYLSAEDLQKVDIDAAWRKLAEKTRDEGILAGATEAEMDAVLAVLAQMQQGVVRGKIAFDAKARNWFHITLTGKANFSTFLHESAHYLLELMRKLEPESPEIAADLRTLEEWAGVEPGKDWSVDALEKFARGMETYFGEGRAPSAKLASAFATFKTWILHVYRTLLNLNAPLTDEVRSVMDRMLATQEEIGARQLELGYFPNVVLLEEGGMSGQEQQAYRDLYEKGAQRAQVEVDREAIAAMRREKSDEYRQIAAEMDKEIDRHPVIALRAWLDGADRTDGGLVPDLNGTTFDPLLVPERYKNRLGDAVAKVGGIDPDELAPYFGFKNKVEMFEALFNTPERSTMKAQMVKAEMVKRYPAYGPDPTWVEQVALEQLHESDAISNALEIELRTIYRKANLLPPQSPALVARQAAQGNVTQMTRKELRPAHWRNEETAMLREQHKALAAKDFPAAAEATRKRLYARAMWQEVQKAQKKIDKAERYVTKYADPAALARLGKSSDMKFEDGTRLGFVIRDAAKVLVEGTGLAEATDLSRNTTFDAQVSRLEDAGLPISVDPVLRERPARAWDDLTYMEAVSIQDALKNLSAVAKGLNAIRVGQNQVLLNDLASEIEASMDEAGLLNRLGQKGEKKSRVRKLRSDIAKPETIAIDIDNGKLGAFHRAFIQTAEAGQFENERRKRQRRQDIRALGKKHAPKDWAEQVAKTHVFKADGRTYTGGEVFAMLLNYGTESNRTKLIKGMQKAGRAWTDENVLAFIHEVFPDRAPYELAQSILSYINRDDLWNDSARVREEIAGVRPEKVPALAIPTPDGGSIEGGYYHLIYNNDVPLSEAEMSNADALNAMHDSNPLNQYAANGFTKGRTGYVAPILLNPTAWTAHLYEVDHFISNAQGIIDRHKLLQHPRIKGAIINGLGIEYWRALRDSNNFIASDGRRMTAELLQASSIMDKLIYHNALLTMGGNLLSGVNQVVTGLPATLSYLGPRGVAAFTRALGRFAKNPFAMWQEAVKLSGELEGMSFHYDRDLRLVAESEIAGHKWDDLKSRFAATMMSPVVAGQKLVNVISFMAGRDIALKEGKSGTEAVAFGNSVIRQSQSASAPKDFTAVQRSHDGMMRVLTSLASYQFTLNDMVMPRQLTKKQLMSSVFRMATLIITTAMVKALFDAMMPRLEEEEAERRKGVEKAAEESEIPGLLAITEATMDVLGNVPLIGRPAQAVLSGRTPRYAAWADTIARSVDLIPKLMSEKGFTKQDLKVLTDTVGLATGIPTRHVFFAPGEFGYELAHGNIEDNPWSFFQDLALVRPGQKGKD